MSHACPRSTRGGEKHMQVGAWTSAAGTTGVFIQNSYDRRIYDMRPCYCMPALRPPIFRVGQHALDPSPRSPKTPARDAAFRTFLDVPTAWRLLTTLSGSSQAASYWPQGPKSRAMSSFARRISPALSGSAPSAVGRCFGRRCDTGIFDDPYLLGDGATLYG